MNGSIKKRGKGSWRIRIFTGYDENGKQTFITKTVRGKKEEAQDEARHIIDELGKGTRKRRNKLTLAEYMQQFLNTTGKLKYAGTTLHRYKEIVQLHLIPNLGDIELQKLTSNDIREYYAEALENGNRQSKGKGLSKRTVLHHHRLLHKILEQAISDDIIAVNPAHKRIAPKPEDKDEMNVITPDEAEHLLEVARTCKYLDCIKFALQTGMRRSEILAAKWGDVNWRNSTINVSRSLEQVERSIGEKSTKTRAGRRALVLMPTTLDLFRHVKAKQAQDKLFLGEAYNDKGYIFAEPNGDCMNPDALTHSFIHYRTKAKLNLTFHDLRHCHASWLLAAGVHPKVVSERLGHSSVQITLDLYSHLLPSIQAAGIAKLAEMLGDYKSFTCVA